MNQIYQQLVAMAYGIWQRRTYALIVAWVVSALGWFLVAQIPNKYESSARIYVDTQTMLSSLMRGMAINTDMLQQLNMVRQTLLSRPNMEKVIRMVDLDLNAKTDNEMESIINDVQKRISLSASGGNLFRLAFEDQDPQLSRKVVQSLLTLFVEANIGASRKDLAGSRRFLDDQIRKHEQELTAAERRRAEFQQKNLGFLPGDTNYFQRLQAVRQELVLANSELEDARVRRNEMKRQLANVPPYITAASGVGGPPIGGVSDLPQRLAAKQRRLDELRERGYKEQHPDVVIMKSTIADLEAELAKEQQLVADQIATGEPGPLPGSNSVAPNPVYEQLKVRLVDMETQIASLQGKLEQRQRAVTQLESMAQRVPEVEAELARLNRDYEIIKANFEKLLERRESARLAQELESKTDGVQIRVIDPPSEPRLPSSPNRLLFLSGVLIVGLGAGVGVAFILSQLHTTYATVQGLRDTFAFPVLGSISAIVNDQERRLARRNLLAFGIGMVGLFLAFGGVVLIEALRGNLMVA